MTVFTDDVERNRLLAEMAEESTDMISRHTPGDWRFIYASPALKHLLGYELEEIIGISAHSLYHPDDVDDFSLRSSSVIYENGLYTHTYRFRCKDGHYTWLESTSRSIRDSKTNELKEILVVSRDASRRLEAEQASRRLARVLEKSSDLVIFVSPLQKITYLNEAARLTLGIGKKNYASSLIDPLFISESYETLIDVGMPAAIELGSWSAELEMCDKKGHTIPVLLELLSHKVVHGRVEYYSIVAKNLSAAKEADAKLKQLQIEMNHASRLISMGELASSLAHELNQPMAAIVNYVRGIQRHFNDKDLISKTDLNYPLDRTAKMALRAGEIIRRMMNYARKQDPIIEPISLYEVANDLIQLCAPNAKQNNVELENLVDKDLPLISADRLQLEQILMNLIINAIDASEESSPENPLSVYIEAIKNDEDMLKIQIRDQGIGLPPGDTQHLFERFYTTKTKGLGLGLAISTSLLESLDAQLIAKNNTDRGACFSFKLPLAK